MADGPGVPPPRGWHGVTPHGGDQRATARDGRALLACTGLRKRLGGRAVIDGLTFSVAAGEAYALLGQRASGKTTALMLAAGLARPEAGEVLLDGRPLGTGASRAKRGLGYVPAGIGLHATYTIVQNLRAFGQLQGLAGRDLDARVRETLERAGLVERAAEPIEHASPATRRLASIAAALVHGPRLLVIDEPAAGIDGPGRERILALLTGLRSEGIGMVLATASVGDVAAVPDRVGFLVGGRIVSEGAPVDLIARAGTQDLAGAFRALPGVTLVT
jgi:ABC-type multidrug transport system ATPase subunit